MNHLNIIPDTPEKICHPVFKELYLTPILNQLNDLGHISIPVTGKPTAYADQIFPQNQLQDHGVIAENAGVYRKPHSTKVEVFGPSLPQLKALRDFIGIGFKNVNQTHINLFNQSYEVVVNPGDHSILTVFTDPTFVAHRWTFNHTIQADDLVEKLRLIIHHQGWDDYLSVLPPFPDGGVQVIRKDLATGHPVDKDSLTHALCALYPLASHAKIAMFGDGHNDIPAMSAPGVIPLTFINAHPSVIEFVRSRHGFVSSSNAPDSNGILNGLKWLNTNNFFQNDQEIINQIIKQP